ncbi:DUF2897 family protein [Vibrio zhugei]|uniref:DUF2897 family protein n=1 Tax=Vibrio zhugei TaxID=2479546 RepID=A0ABV7C8I9_9VIBR|nr:DUF2897 family protein [Vibrio zhugei]
MELLFNPWVIIIGVLCIIIGNIAALKYTSKMKFDQWQKKPPTKENATPPTSSPDSDSSSASSSDSSIKKER